LIPKTPRYVINAPLASVFTIPRIQRGLLELRITDCKWDGNCGVGAVAGNVWSRAARRRPQETTDGNIKLGFRISVQDTKMASTVAVEWRIGSDVVLFESFCGKVKTVVQNSESHA
jgi:hypothetical protein